MLKEDYSLVSRQDIKIRSIFVIYTRTMFRTVSALSNFVYITPKSRKRSVYELLL